MTYGQPPLRRLVTIYNVLPRAYKEKRACNSQCICIQGVARILEKGVLKRGGIRVQSACLTAAQGKILEPEATSLNNDVIIAFST